MNKLDLETKNIIDDNIGKIGSIFPSVIVESENGKSVDFDLLKQELSHILIEGNKEKYQLTWPGKKESIVLANTPITKTLRPIQEKSVDFDNTENIYIEGDNLEVLKILQESYLKKIKCIYMDPPYNTGKNLIYKNDFSNSSTEELINAGIIDSDGYRLVVNSDTSGRFHSDWNSMMYARIKLSRNLLTDDGCLVLAIDESEVINLTKICDEIYGEQNRLGIITVVHKPEGRNQAKHFSPSNEYALFYAKNESKFALNSVILDNELLKEFSMEDELGKYKLVSAIAKNHGRSGFDKNLKVNNPKNHYPVYVSNDLTDISFEDKDGYKMILPNTSTQERTWKYIRENFWEKIVNKEIIAIKENNEIKLFEKYRETKGQLIKTHWIDKKYNANTSGGRILDDLMKVKTFDFPKSLYLIIDILKIIIKSDDYVLDLFSGSATTAHACMQLNAEDNGRRKYIMTQLPEKCEENTEAFKEGYRNICDIGQERIRRAGKKIKEETNADIDYGFRVYKVDTSNMSDVYHQPNDLKQTELRLFEENIKEDRTSEDLLTQVILDLGLTLDLKIESKVINNNNVYFVDDNSLIACFDNNININMIDEIVKYNPLKVVFRDSTFASDNDRINVEEKFKKYSPETEVSII